MSHPPLLRSDLLAGVAGLRHGFFTRHGGVSSGLYESLNVGRGSRDHSDDVAENRRRAAAALGATTLNTAYQIHSTHVVVIDAPFDETSPQADGVLTQRPGLLCGALAADCAPILIVDPAARVVGAVHAGWRGALDGVVASAVAGMIKLGARPSRMLAAIGPCIGPLSYEVGPEFKARFESDDRGNRAFFSAAETADKSLFDLPGYVLSRLAAARVGTAEWIGRDTAADTDFFSNRRATRRGEADYGRLLSAIMLDA